MTIKLTIMVGLRHVNYMSVDYYWRHATPLSSEGYELTGEGEKKRHRVFKGGGI